MKKAYTNSYLHFISGTGSTIVFTCLFFSFWLVINTVGSATFDLHSFSGRMIGTATLQNIDVEARVSLFYKSLLLFFGSFTVFSLVAFLIFKKKENLLHYTETKLINHLSIAGMFLFLFRILKVEVYETLELIYFLQKLLLLSLLLRTFIFKNNRLSVYSFSLILLLAVSLYFFVADINIFFGNSGNPDFFITTFVIAALLLLAANIYLKNDTGYKQPVVLAYVLLPLLMLPFMTVLKDEAFLVLKYHQVLLTNQLPIYCVLIVSLCLVIVFRARKANKRQIITEKELLAKRYFPTAIFSLIAYLSYSYYTDYYDELFESGNVYLPIMEFKLFGTLSPIEKLNTHLLSDNFFSWIYVLFNGLKINELTLYDFLLAPISYTLFYFLIKFLTRNEFVSAFCVLLFPFAEAVLPEGFCLAILGVFALIRIIQSNQTIKNYLVFFATLLFLACWRIDLGFNCIVAMPFVLLFYHIFDTDWKINWKILIKAVAVFSVSIVILGILFSLYRHVNLFAKLPSFFNYCISAQSYGYQSIGNKELVGYNMQYFVFPAFVVMLCVMLLIKYKNFNHTKNQRLAHTSLIFICIFHIANFNRGLIRHSLLEGVDGYVASFVYIILPGSVFFILKKEAHLVKCVLFFLIATFLVYNYRIPEPTGMKGLFEKLQDKIKNTKNIDLAALGSRFSNTPPDAPTERHKLFSDFINKHTKPEETFLDFSNRPMLYFFSKKETPSWFYQTPLCIQNDFLQEKYIADLARYKTPYLLFSGVSDIGYDNIDGVPNALRHYRMAEYFYQNYSPSVIVDGFCIWKNNKTNDVNRKDTIFSYNRQKDTAALDNITVAIKIKQNKVYTAKVISENEIIPELTLKCNDSLYNASLIGIGQNAAYSVLNVKGKKFDVLVKNSDHRVNNIFIVESDYIPDYFSEKIVSYNFEKLPYVWGTYDKLVNSEPVLFENTLNVELKSGQPLSMVIPQNIDKTTGNTIILRCTNNSEKPQKVILFFGNSKNKQKNNISFELTASAKEEKYAIRISAIHKWYANDTNELIFVPETDKSVTVSKIQISKGK